MAGQHLVLGVARGIQREQRVEHHHHVVAGDEGADQRVEQRQISVRDEFQRGGGGRSHNRWAADAAGHGKPGGGAQKLATIQAVFS